MLQKRLHPAPPLYSIDPAFNTRYNESLHGEKLACGLNIEHLSPVQQRTLRDLIKKHVGLFLMDVVLSNMSRAMHVKSTQGITHPLHIKVSHMVIWRPQRLKRPSLSNCSNLAKCVKFMTVHGSQKACWFQSPIKSISPILKTSFGGSA